MTLTDIPTDQLCQWQMRDREHCERLATARSGLGGLVNWVCEEHLALEMPSHTEAFR